MIPYESGTWAVGLVFQVKGSVLPKSVCWALPAGILAAINNWIYRTYYGDMEFENLSMVSGGYSVVLGFLLVFRAQTAYSRFWDGASYLQTIRSGWFNATSSLFAFCTDAEDKRVEVQQFQHGIVRLMSLMYSSALQVVSGADSHFPVFDFEGLDPAAMQFAECQHDKLEVIMQWVQSLIVKKHMAGIVNIPPPILSRVFQELSNGMLDVANAKRIYKLPFPFPYAQMISLMLMAHFITTVVIASLSMSSQFMAFWYAFLATLGIWSINYIAIEIEMPFGTDPNDLQLDSMQKSMNDCLALLMHPMVQTPPVMSTIEPRHLKVGLRKWMTNKDKAVRVEIVNEHGEVSYALGQEVARRPAPKSDTREKIDTKSEAKARPPEPAVADVIAVTLEKQFEILSERIGRHTESLASELRQYARNSGSPRWNDGWNGKQSASVGSASPRQLQGDAICQAQQFSGAQLPDAGSKEARATPDTSSQVIGSSSLLNGCGGGVRCV